MCESWRDWCIYTFSTSGRSESQSTSRESHSRDALTLELRAAQHVWSVRHSKQHAEWGCISLIFYVLLSISGSNQKSKKKNEAASRRYDLVLKHSVALELKDGFFLPEAPWNASQRAPIGSDQWVGSMCQNTNSPADSQMISQALLITLSTLFFFKIYSQVRRPQQDISTRLRNLPTRWWCCTHYPQA